MLNYEVERPISKRKKNKKIIGLMKDELGRKIMTEFVGLRAKTYRYLTNDNEENKTGKGKKKLCNKKKTLLLKKYLEDYKNCSGATHLENKIICLNNNKIDVKSLIENHRESITNNQITLKSQQRFKSKKHNVFTEDINKVVLSSNYDLKI